MVKKILAVLAVVLAILAIVIHQQPSHFRVERSITIAAPPAVVFGYLNDFKKWEKWSPWSQKDPAAKVKFDGPLSGTGAIFSWDGNKEVGMGKMTITESVPNETVAYRLEFEKPMKGTSAADFRLKSEGTGTMLTWGMEGDNNFMAKAFGLVVDCDKMIGGDFETGLTNLKSLAEANKV